MQDPIAAATAAKRQREGVHLPSHLKLGIKLTHIQLTRCYATVERLKLVAGAAAKAFDHSGKTTFFVGDNSPRAVKFMAQLKGVASSLLHRKILVSPQPL